MRLFVFLAFIIIIYLVLKKYFSGFFSPKVNKTPPPPITDELVKDPVCGTYVPKREALVYGRKGKLYYFCCEECLKKFKKG